MDDLTGRILSDRYFLREMIGSGGMADVYLVWDKPRSTKMAIKVLRRDLANDPKFLERFSKEAELLQQIEHPNIVRLYEFSLENDVVYIVLDWVEGSNLRQLILNYGRPLPLKTISQVLQPMCSALNFAHQCQVFHCDVKPANILLHNDGRVLLTDFGVARLAKEKVGGGTPAYMAPEQFTNNGVSTQTDVYSMGVTLYEMLSGGFLPYKGESPSSQGSTQRDRIAWEIFNVPYPKLRKFNRNISEAIEGVVDIALSKQASYRFQTTLELWDAFEQARKSSAAGDNWGGDGLTELLSVVNNPLDVHTEKKPPSDPSPPPLPPPVDEGPRIPQQFPIYRGGPHLICRTGDYTGQVIGIPKDGLRIGRSSSNHLKINEANVSRIHAIVLVTRRGVYVRDENSVMGTYCNRQRIMRPTKLRSGDIIQIGYYQVFEFREK